MKKLIFSLAASLLISASTFAYEGGKKEDDANKVSYSVKNEFDATFGGVEDVVWTVTADFQKAEFSMDDVKTTAYYNNKGEYLGYTQLVSMKALPTSARKEIAAKYKGYGVNEIIKFRTGDSNGSSLSRLAVGGTFDEVSYFVSLEKEGQKALVRVTPYSSLEVVNN
ncbi:hypothetical protein KHS38_01700 [Mucilaginibacter sp. Bleaf8]|uniref:hypothetical protein n=1 Tax=Mucilaginibacter sp. Bleaf8 TaxID=2834430 RepID=UPI001BD14639|nr:hypothetical protein [Mucilaginibacter sp. Bleaf8]MBS7563106.1 hypothetical protein [Mucilaginibacter sp. Bleaf8]